MDTHTDTPHPSCPYLGSQAQGVLVVVQQGRAAGVTEVHGGLQAGHGAHPPAVHPVLQDLHLQQHAAGVLRPVAVGASQSGTGQSGTGQSNTGQSGTKQSGLKRANNRSRIEIAINFLSISIYQP